MHTLYTNLRFVLVVNGHFSGSALMERSILLQFLEDYILRWLHSKLLVTGWKTVAG